MNTAVVKVSEIPQLSIYAMAKKSPAATDQIDNTNFSSKLKNVLLKIPALGILCSLASGLFFATASVSVKLVTSISPLEILTIRAVFQAIVFLPIVVYTRKPFFGVANERLPLFFSVLLGTISSALSYYAFRLIPLGDATTIVFTSPVFVSIFACILLKEPCGVLQVISIVIALFGVLLISKPSFIFGDNVHQHVSASNHLQGICMACISCLSAALAFICLRKLVKTPSSVTTLMLSLFTLFSGVVVLMALQDLKLPANWTESLILLGAGVCGACGQFLVTVALKYEKAGPVAVARTVDIVVAYIFQVTLLQEPTSWTSGVGAVLIASCIIVTACHKWYEEQPESFKFIRSLSLNCQEKHKEAAPVQILSICQHCQIQTSFKLNTEIPLPHVPIANDNYKTADNSV